MAAGHLWRVTHCVHGFRQGRRGWPFRTRCREAFLVRPDPVAFPARTQGARAMSAVIQVCGLTRQFGGLAAVRNVTMAVEENEIRGLIGPNGAGKTTVLGLIGGQLKPSAGTVAFQGIDISRLRADQRAASGIRRTFQNLKLFPDMTVLENVMVGFHTQTHCEILQALLRTPAQHREERMVVEEGCRVLERVGLREQAAIPARLLAYGHRRLLEVARSGE